MTIIENIKDLRAFVKENKQGGKTIGFVPTMGYLHEGHISLVKESSRENDITVMSIFVNPIQFGPKEDFSKYPRDFERDSRIAEEAGVDIIFVPDSVEMYPEGYNTYVNVERLTDKLCGGSRPGHFRGVTTVVNKLFNIVEADKAYFGQKDAQQAIVIKRMARDLNMNVEIVICPIIREKEGLAMSSRNAYLNMEQRKAALVLPKSLFKAKELIAAGESGKEAILGMINEMISAEELAKIDYIEAVNAESLEEISEIKGKVLVAAAVWIGTTRLIDNIIVEV